MSAEEHCFLHCLNELAGFVSAKRCDYLLIAGGFNVDFSRIHRQHIIYTFLSDMMKILILRRLIFSIPLRYL